MRCQRISRFVHLCSRCFSVCGSIMHSGNSGLATGTNKWEYALIGGLCLNRKRAGRTASVRFEVAMQSVFQEKCSYTMAFRVYLPVSVHGPGTLNLVEEVIP